MPIGKGTYRIGPDTGALTVRTGRDGFGALIGHDLVLEATRWRGTVVVDPDDPGRAQVEVTVEAGSLQVTRAEGGLKPLSDKDRGDIHRTIQEKILQTATMPDIVFRSTTTAGTAPALSVSGDLTIRGRTGPVTPGGQPGRAGRRHPGDRYHDHRAERVRHQALLRPDGSPQGARQRRPARRRQAAVGLTRPGRQGIPDVLSEAAPAVG